MIDWDKHYPPSEWDRMPRYTPERPPYKPEQSREMELRRYIAAVWIGPAGDPRVLGMHHLRKGAEKHCRESMRDYSSEELNRHTRFYVWDSTRPWNPDDIRTWTPIARWPRHQYVLDY